MAKDFRAVISGLPALQHMLRTAPNDVKPLAEMALTEEAQVIFARSQRLVPVRHGILKASGMVSRAKSEGSDMHVDITYGGPAATYAMWVHELNHRHEAPTQRKYLQRPVEERTPNIPRNMAKRIEDMIRRALEAGMHK